MTDKYQYCLVLRKAPQVTLTISPTPSDATVKINGTTQSSISVYAGDTVNFEVSKSGYRTQKGNIIVQRSATANIELSTACTVSAEAQQDGVTITVTDTINTATQSGRSAVLTTVAGRNVTVTMTKQGYTTKTQTFSNISENKRIIWSLAAAASS